MPARTGPQMIMDVPWLWLRNQPQIDPSLEPTEGSKLHCLSDDRFCFPLHGWRLPMLVTLLPFAVGRSPQI